MYSKFATNEPAGHSTEADAAASAVPAYDGLVENRLALIAVPRPLAECESELAALAVGDVIEFCSAEFERYIIGRVDGPRITACCYRSGLPSEKWLRSELLPRLANRAIRIIPGDRPPPAVAPTPAPKPCKSRTIADQLIRRIRRR